MNVLFVAIGGSRLRGIVAEAAQVVRDGGQALILVDTIRPWQGDVLPDGVELAGFGGLERDHLPMRIARAIIFTAPDRILQAVGKGPARAFSKRARGAYKRRLAEPVHRRVVRVYRKVWRNRHLALIMALIRDRDVDFVVVPNYASLVWGARIQRELDANSVARPRVRFSVDHLVDVAIG